MRPFQFALNYVVTRILDGTFVQGNVLPPERLLAQEIGVTRPTLREVYQALASEGWLTIQHGKPTQINTLTESGNLAMINRLAEYPQFIPPSITTHLLQVRSCILPEAARSAFENYGKELRAHLEYKPLETDPPERWAEYDWSLQLMILKYSGNPLFKMIFNDFQKLFLSLGSIYFSFAEAKSHSKAYYSLLEQSQTVALIEELVKKTMIESQKLWCQLESSKELEKKNDQHD